MDSKEALEQALMLMDYAQKLPLDDVVERYANQRQAELYIKIAAVMVMKEKRLSMYDDQQVEIDVSALVDLEE